MLIAIAKDFIYLNNAKSLQRRRARFAWQRLEKDTSYSRRHKKQRPLE